MAAVAYLEGIAFSGHCDISFLMKKATFITPKPAHTDLLLELCAVVLSGQMVGLGLNHNVQVVKFYTDIKIALGICPT